jgi:hypothetical protein
MGIAHLGRGKARDQRHVADERAAFARNRPDDPDQRIEARLLETCFCVLRFFSPKYERRERLFLDAHRRPATRGRQVRKFAFDPLRRVAVQFVVQPADLRDMGRKITGQNFRRDFTKADPELFVVGPVRNVRSAVTQINNSCTSNRSARKATSS